MSGEVVKYDNELNAYNLGNLSETEINIVYALFYKMKDKGALEVSFNLSELKSLINYKRKDSFSRFAFDTLRKLQRFTLVAYDKESASKDGKTYGSGKYLNSFVVIPKLRLDTETGDITVVASDELQKYLNQLTKNFTKFALEDMTRIKGTYAKKLYPLLMQFKSTGVVIMSIDEMRFKLSIPESYKQSAIDKVVIETSIKELSGGEKVYVENLKCWKLKEKGRGRGGKVSRVVFTFNPIKETPEFSNMDFIPAAPRPNFGRPVVEETNIVVQKPQYREVSLIRDIKDNYIPLTQIQSPYSSNNYYIRADKLISFIKASRKAIEKIESQFAPDNLKESLFVDELRSFFVTYSG